LQVMEVQQDAVKYICETLEVPYSRPNELEAIRIIRNDAIGHAMRGKEEKVWKSSFIQRFDMTQLGFILLTVFSDRRDYVRRQVNMAELIGIQRTFLTDKLQSVVDKLRSDELAHREKHKDQLLQDIFPDTLGYLFSKITEISPISGPCLQEMKGMLVRFRKALEERGEWGSDSGVAYYYGPAEYAVSELERYFNSADHPSRLNAQDVFIFASFLKTQIEELRGIAKEIDDEYAAAV
jgi:hypothetical protein